MYLIILFIFCKLPTYHTYSRKITNKLEVIKNEKVRKNGKKTSGISRVEQTKIGG